MKTITPERRDEINEKLLYEADLSGAAVRDRRKALKWDTRELKEAERLRQVWKVAGAVAYLVGPDPEHITDQAGITDPERPVYQDLLEELGLVPYESGQRDKADAAQAPVIKYPRP